MKVTAILPDELITAITTLSQGRNITESLKIALGEWVQIQNLKRLNHEIDRKSLDFDYSAEELRVMNRAR